MSKRGMGAATKGGGCCMGGMAVKKYADGSPKEGVTKDMLPWMSKELDKKSYITKDMMREKYLKKALKQPQPWMSKELNKKSYSGPAEGVTKDMLPWMSKMSKASSTKKKRKPPFEPMVPRK